MCQVLRILEKEKLKLKHKMNQANEEIVNKYIETNEDTNKDVDEDDQAMKTYTEMDNTLNQFTEAANPNNVPGMDINNVNDTRIEENFGDIEHITLAPEDDQTDDVSFKSYLEFENPPNHQTNRKYSLHDALKVYQDAHIVTQHKKVDRIL